MTAVETAIAQENPLSIRGALLWGAQVLLQAGLENSRLDAEVLLRHVLDLEKEQLYMNGDAPISAGQEGKFRELVLRRSRREPVAYITGRKEFWSLDFFVSSAVLIPRPETELLVELVLQYVGRLAGGSAGEGSRYWHRQRRYFRVSGQRASGGANRRPGHFPCCFGCSPRQRRASRRGGSNSILDGRSLLGLWKHLI